MKRKKRARAIERAQPERYIFQVVDGLMDDFVDEAMDEHSKWHMLLSV
jgi:hypothetical protein